MAGEYIDTAHRSTCERTLLSGVKTNHDDTLTLGVEVY